MGRALATSSLLQLLTCERTSHLRYKTDQRHALQRSGTLMVPQRWPYAGMPWKESRIVDQPAATIAIRCQKPTRLLGAQSQNRRSRDLRSPPCHNLRKNLYALQFGPLIVTKSNLCLPNLIFGRVVWTFQLCTNRTLQLCAYKSTIHKGTISELKANLPVTCASSTGRCNTI